MSAHLSLAAALTVVFSLTFAQASLIATAFAQAQGSRVALSAADQQVVAAFKLLRLPQLPKQVKYRFVRSNLLLVDRENGLIIDYMTNALP